MPTTPFPKHSRTDDELVDLMVSRGLRVTDRATALRDLQTYGYHRLGGYRYPLRRLLPTEQQQPEQRRFRTDDFIEGASHEDVMRLYHFDRRLRQVVLQGVLDYEVRLRSALTAVVSARGAYAHIDEPSGCLGPRGRRGPEMLSRWKQTVQDATHDSRNTDAVAHHLVAYQNTPLPVWIALDIVSFGALPYFMDLMRDEDRNAVANLFGVRNGNALTRWTRAFVDLRNACAHDVRLFNSNVKRSFEIRPSEVPADALQYLRVQKPAKIYMHLALLAYTLRSHPADTQWHLQLRTQVRKFPTGITDGAGTPIGPAVMGFPEDWEHLAPWTT